jgi:exopolyphosphatase / guanosine-5'-triphosphate,3'-diphosphate pyrophosphatase
MLFASIDIGSNAVRLLFANVFENKNRESADKASLIRIPIRLGLDVFNDGRISDEKANNLVKTMNAFKLLLEVYKPLSFIACATSAMREASNSDEILKHVFDETGINVRVIDGQEEAGIISSLNRISINRQFGTTMYVDVGGGSTEISVMAGERFINSASFNIGTLRLLCQKVEESEWDKMEKWLKPFQLKQGQINVVGSGGNINKLTKLYGSTTNNTITLKELEYANKHLGMMSMMERIETMGLRPDRADVIVPASDIFVRILKWAHQDYVIAPKIGLADGLVLRLFNEYTLAGNIA